jgi:hypothetical protein
VTYHTCCLGHLDGGNDSSCGLSPQLADTTWLPRRQRPGTFIVGFNVLSAGIYELRPLRFWELRLVSDVALIVTAIGVLGVVVGLWQSNRQRLHQFEELYVQRYWTLLDRFSLNILKGSSADQITADEDRAIRSYFFLCEDELEMRAKGSISDSTYATWVSAIRQQLDQPMFGDVSSRISKEDVFPYEYISQLLDKGKDYDPCRMSLLRRWLRGLAGHGV